MQVFAAVVDAGSFSAAADTLDITPVMVGKHVRQLESQLGLRLIERSTRRHSITEAGKQYYASCRQVLELIQQADAALEPLHHQPRGLLRVSAPVTMGSQVIAPCLAAYLARYPEVEVELLLSNSMVDLIGDNFDLAVRVGPLRDEGLVAKALPPHQLALAASPDYLARYGTPAHPAELAEHHCLTHRLWSERQGWTSITDRDGNQWPTRSRLACNDSQALRQLALQGAGITRQPLVLLRADLAAGALLPVLPDYWPAPLPCNLVYLPDVRPRPKLHSLVDYLLEVLPDWLAC
ncbi:DNA-binding transcriptional regulator, LysR family [Andreprevotia lacus DSM 23236]|jgi:DNA-binding transcriptional LysR family regulator|uniref:DNA-binding transcriptional regulator, LysR family n=2 Tax=Andreprevotia TaxID=397275 RepID=A0A1W1Y182_9NEIS|nr:DNA-binding transcriptional regulator, LysR family [Andreprevotia lacus DSM 23236]